jgi:DnaJ-class molecular chaperone
MTQDTDQDGRQLEPGERRCFHCQGMGYTISALQHHQRLCCPVCSGSGKLLAGRQDETDRTVADD